MLGDNAALDIGWAAGRVVDDHGDRLALVELGQRGLRARGDGKHGHAGDDQQSLRHRFLPAVVPALSALFYFFAAGFAR